MIITFTELEEFSRTIFAAIGCDDAEARNISRLLVRANLTGHDSHGVIRISQYIEFWRKGDVIPNQTASINFENDSFFRQYEKFSFFDKSADMADFYEKKLGKVMYGYF